MKKSFENTAGKMPSFDVVDLKKFPTSLNILGKMYSRYRGCFFQLFPSVSHTRTKCVYK